MTRRDACHWCLTSERLSGTITFLFSDIEGSTRLLRVLGRDTYGEVLSRHQELVREQFIRHRGEEIDTQGDAFFVAFRSASDAVAAAVSIQRTLAGEAWPDGEQVQVRIGIHSGEASAAGERYVGFSVHRAARVGAVAHGGQVLLSSTTRELVEDDLPAGVSLRDLGAHRLKDIERPERITQVIAEGLQQKFPPLRTGRRPLRRQPRVVVPAALLPIAVAVAVAFLLVGGRSGKPQASAGIPADSLGVFGESGRAIGNTAVKTAPHGVAAGDGAVWVTNTDDNSVSRIDPKTNAVVQTIPVGDGPEGIATGGGFVWVADSLANRVSQIDPGTNTVVNSISVGNGPTGVAFGLGGVWVTNSADRTLVRLDPATAHPSPPVTVEAGAAGVAVGFGYVWVTSGSSPGGVSRIDPHTLAVEQTIPTGSDPTGVAVGRGAVWVANSEDGTVSRLQAGSTRQTVVIVGAGPAGVAVNDGAIWVSNELSGTLSKLDPVTGRVERTVETGNRPLGLATGSGRLYVAVRTYGTAHRGGTLTILAPSLTFLGKLDPANVYNVESQQMLILTNDGLTAYRRTGGSDGLRLVPDLATSLPAPTDGGRTYTFQLRHGIRYSTGKLVRPDDFRRALERSLADAKGPGQYFFSDIVGASACTSKRCDLARGIVADAETNTVTFHLTQPDPSFLYKLAQPTADAVPASTPLAPQRKPLPATGPYMFVHIDPAHSIRLIRNPHFHEWAAAAQPPGFPDEIVWKDHGDPLLGSAWQPPEIRAVERGRGDLVLEGVPQTLAREVETRFAAQTHRYTQIDTSFFSLNVRVPPFNDVRVRQALNYALDRRRLAAMVSPPGRPTCQLLPPGFFGYRRYCPYTRNPRADGRYSGPDLAKAKRLVAASGTTRQTITLWAFTRDSTHLAEGRYVASVLRALGYRANIKFSKKEFDLLNNPRDNSVRFTLNGGWNPDYPSPINFFGLLLSCKAARTANANNYSHFCDPKLDAQMGQADSLQTTDPQRAQALWIRIDREVADKAPMVFLRNDRGLDFVSRRVGNYQYNPQWHLLLDQLWVR